MCAFRCTSHVMPVSAACITAAGLANCCGAHLHCVHNWQPQQFGTPHLGDPAPDDILRPCITMRCSLPAPGEGRLLGRCAAGHARVGAHCRCGLPAGSMMTCSLDQPHAAVCTTLGRQRGMVAAPSSWLVVLQLLCASVLTACCRAPPLCLLVGVPMHLQLLQWPTAFMPTFCPTFLQGRRHAQCRGGSTAATATSRTSPVAASACSALLLHIVPFPLGLLIAIACCSKHFVAVTRGYDNIAHALAHHQALMPFHLPCDWTESPCCHPLPHPPPPSHPQGVPASVCGGGQPVHG